MTTGKALNGKPYAGNPHVRFDEGEVASAATPRRGSLLYNYMTKIADYEAAVERRLEKSCERDGWIASAHVSFDADYVDCQLEKFGKEEVRDEADALNSLEAFLSQEFGFSLADKPTALRRDSEKIPNTIAPYHLVLNVKVPFDVRKVA